MMRLAKKDRCILWAGLLGYVLLSAGVFATLATAPRKESKVAEVDDRQWIAQEAVLMLETPDLTGSAEAE